MRLIIILVLIGAAYAVPRQSTRIVGGESTPIENYPFMANMLLDWMDGLIQTCGGTLITQTAVVSAAHCYVGDPPSRWRVGLGSSLASPGENIHTIARIISHEQYNPRLTDNDIAVIRLNNPAVFSDKINISRIAGPRYILPDNTLVRAIGWGDVGCDKFADCPLDEKWYDDKYTKIENALPPMSKDFEGFPPEDLQHVEVYTINHQICTERYAYLKTLPDHVETPQVSPDMLCTGILDVGGKDACTGDSGGPVIHGTDILVGIVSWSHECGDPIYPGVSVRVSSYTHWIFTNSIN